MKDYLIYTNLENKKELRKQFILGYKIFDELKKIIIYFADGTNYSVDYNSDTEKMILEKMKQQFINYQSKFEESLNNKKREQLHDDIKRFVLFLVLGIGCLALGFGVDLVIAKVWGLILTIFSSIGSWCALFANRSYKRTFNDYEKNKLFLENEILINNMLNSHKAKNIFANVESNIKNAAPVRNNGTIEMTINSIDELSLKEMKDLLEAIKKELMFETTFEERNDKVLKK